MRGRWLRAVPVFESVGIEQRGLDRGTADIDCDDKIALSGIRGRPWSAWQSCQESRTDRDRCRGSSGLSPLASANATASRCALIKSAIGSRPLLSTYAPVALRSSSSPGGGGPNTQTVEDRPTTLIGP